MITWKKAAGALLIASLLSSSMAPMAMAASKTKVGKISLTIDSDIRTGREGGDVEVTPTGDNTDRYYVDSWEVTNDNGDTWTRSNPPEIDIVLGVEDEEEYYFSSTSSSSFKLTLGSSSKYRFDKIKIVDAKRKDSNATLILTIQLIFDKDADISSATAPAGLSWDDARNGMGSWNPVSSSKYYQVQLMKDGSDTGDMKDIYDTSYNFADQITSPGTYRFKVRSVKSSNSAKSSWSTSNAWAVNEADITAMGNTPQASAPDGGSWQQAAAGSRRPTASDGGGAIRMVPAPSQPGRISMASGTTLMPRAIWQPDGLSLTASPITLTLQPAPCTPIRGHRITAGWMHPEHGCPEHDS